MVLVDDDSRHLTTVQVKTKDEACIWLQNYLTYIEQQFNFKPKRIQFDQGMEFLKKKSINWSAEHSIKIEPTAPYSPSQNGITEQFNCTIIESA